MATTSVRLVVHGSVQGVGFRFAACEAASECVVAGWVRNVDDGSVELVAQGSPGAVPTTRSVARVEVETIPVSAELHGFTIRR
jgi:acylphosphatase